MTGVANSRQEKTASDNESVTLSLEEITRSLEYNSKLLSKIHQQVDRGDFADYIAGLEKQFRKGLNVSKEPFDSVKASLADHIQSQIGRRDVDVEVVSSNELRTKLLNRSRSKLLHRGHDEIDVMRLIKGEHGAKSTLLLNEEIFRKGDPACWTVVIETGVGILFAEEKLKTRPNSLGSKVVTLMNSAKTLRDKITGKRAGKISRDENAVLMYRFSFRHLKHLLNKSDVLVAVPSWETFKETLQNNNKNMNDGEMVSIAHHYDTATKHSTEYWHSRGNPKPVEKGKGVYPVQSAAEYALRMASYDTLVNPADAIIAALYHFCPKESENSNDRYIPKVSEITKGMLRGLDELLEIPFDSESPLEPGKTDFTTDFLRSRFVQETRRIANEQKIDEADLAALYFARKAHDVDAVRFIDNSSDRWKAKKILNWQSQVFLLPYLEKFHAKKLFKTFGYLVHKRLVDASTSKLQHEMKLGAGGADLEDRQQIAAVLGEYTTPLLQEGQSFTGRDKDIMSVGPKFKEIEKQLNFQFTQLREVIKTKTECLPGDPAIVSTLNILKKIQVDLMSQIPDSTEKASGKSNIELQAIISNFIDPINALVGSEAIKLSVPPTEIIQEIGKSFAARVVNTDTIGIRLISSTPKATMDMVLKEWNRAPDEGNKSENNSFIGTQIEINGYKYRVQQVKEIQYPSERRYFAGGNWVLGRAELTLVSTERKETLFVPFEVQAITEEELDKQDDGSGTHKYAHPHEMLKEMRAELHLRGKNADDYRTYEGIGYLDVSPKTKNTFVDRYHAWADQVHNYPYNHILVQSGDPKIPSLELRVAVGTTLSDLTLFPQVRKALEAYSKAHKINQKTIAVEKQDYELEVGNRIFLSDLIGTFSNKESNSQIARASKAMSDMRKPGKKELSIAQQGQRKVIEALSPGIQDPNAKLPDHLIAWLEKRYAPLLCVEPQTLYAGLSSGALNIDELLHEIRKHFVMNQCTIETTKSKENTYLQLKVNTSAGPVGLNYEMMRDLRVLANGAGTSLMSFEHGRGRTPTVFKFRNEGNLDFVTRFKEKLCLQSFPLTPTVESSAETVEMSFTSRNYQQALERLFYEAKENSLSCATVHRKASRAKNGEVTITVTFQFVGLGDDNSLQTKSDKLKANVAIHSDKFPGCTLQFVEPK